MTNQPQKGYLILLFLLSPFLGLMTLLKSKSEKFLTFFGIFFFGLLGSVFVYVEGTDGHSHLENAKTLYLDMSLGEFLVKTFEILTFSSTEGSTDLYLHVISFVSSSVLSIPELIHVFSGFVLGYFFTKSVLLILKNNLKTKKSYILIGFIVLLLLIQSIGALNSIRMWTGMWVLFYGIYSWSLTKERKYIFVILFSVLVHFSYVVIIIPIMGSYLLRKRKTILIFLYIVSFTASLSFSYFSAYIPESDLLENKQKYNVIDSNKKAERFQKDNEIAQEKRSSLNFYKAFGQTIYVNYSIVGLSIILLFFYFNKKIDANLNFLVTVGIGLYTFANFVAFSPSLQGRTKTIASLFILAAAIHLQLTLKKYYLNMRKKRLLNSGLVLFLISAIPMALFQISDIFYNISFFFLLFPQISWFLGDADLSIRAAIGILID
jgi:hypothetical protein